MSQLYFGADHAGRGLKDQLVAAVRAQGAPWSVEDLGTTGDASVHYPNFAFAVAEKVGGGKGLGVLVCGSGIGMAIAANKVVGVRAAVCWDATSARLTKEHNDANILCLGARLLGVETAQDALFAWLRASFAGGRHAERVALIGAREQKSK